MKREDERRRKKIGFFGVFRERLSWEKLWEV